ncbi:hypothetical protein [Streptomyces sp. NPDC057702]|uniref:hypothetical protein n=1 Tax=unclassified Streptomyces TaxID=2593676 RepID=UPI0036A5A60D
MAERSGYHPCTCLALDVQAYGANNDRRQSDIQHDLPRLLSRAALTAGVDRSRWQTQAQGDGHLAVLPMDGSEPRVVDDYLRHLAAALAEHNRTRVPEARMRLRAAVHHGPVEIADNGFAGQAVVTTCRLRDATPLRRALAAAPAADLVLGLSNSVFQTTVAGGHTTLRAEAFRQVTVDEKEYRALAWVWLPGHDVHRLDLGAVAAPVPASGGPEAEHPADPPPPGRAAGPQPAPGRIPGQRVGAGMPRTADADRDADPEPGADPDAEPGVGAGGRADAGRERGGTHHTWVEGGQVSVANFHGEVDLRGGVIGFGTPHE